MVVVGLSAMLYQLRSRWTGLGAVFDVGWHRLYSGVQRPIVAQVKFLVDGVNAIFHRLGAQHQLLGDGGVVVALGHHVQHFLLARG